MTATPVPARPGGVGEHRRRAALRPPASSRPLNIGQMRVLNQVPPAAYSKGSSLRNRGIETETLLFANKMPTVISDKLSRGLEVFADCACAVGGSYGFSLYYTTTLVTTQLKLRTPLL